MPRREGAEFDWDTPGPENTHKDKGMVSGKGLWRSTGGSRPQGHREGPILVGKAGRRAYFEVILDFSRIS